MVSALDNYKWLILPRRKVAHAFAHGHSNGFCGLTDSYPKSELTEATHKTRKCEACLLAIVTGANPLFYKFFVGYYPSNVRRQRSVAWKAFLREHPEYGPPSWRDRSIGAKT